MGNSSGTETPESGLCGRKRNSYGFVGAQIVGGEPSATFRPDPNRDAPLRDPEESQTPGRRRNDTPFGKKDFDEHFVEYLFEEFKAIDNKARTKSAQKKKYRSDVPLHCTARILISVSQKIRDIFLGKYFFKNSNIGENIAVCNWIYQQVMIQN